MAEPRTVAAKRWRVGAKLGRTIYRDEKVVGMVDTPELAEKLVDAVNVAEESRGAMTAKYVVDPHDYGSAIRPHTIKNCWQVWSGGLCIALVDDEKLPEAMRGHWRAP